VYNKLQLVKNYNDYAFATKLNKDLVPKEEFELHHKDNFDELWYKTGPGNVVIIAKQDNFLIESITLFSYLFCAFLLITAVFWLINAFIRSRLNKVKFKTYWQLSIRNQIHGTVIFISVLSFIVIGIATILFFIRRYENNNRERLSRTIKVMEKEMRNSLIDLAAFDDVIKIYDEGFKEKLEQMVLKISEIHDADINLYDLDGNLKVSSLPLPYVKGIVSTKMDPLAYYHINKQKEVQYFKEEKIGTLKFVSNYVPVIDETGKEYAYLNIPYFTSQSKLRLEIANFLVTIINLNAFIFLIAGIVALFITNRITRSFSFISNKMKEVNLGKLNEAIEWNRSDEIGELVKEYNKMVAKLDNSATALAKSEREGAWREMARQVAHEIKNPLTPMKLSLQYLQKAIANNTDNVRQLTASVAQTLVEQIDHLNQIAGEFSQFANIGNPRNEVFDLHEILYVVTQLHGVNDKVELKWNPLPQRVLINADRTHINRLFTNLIQNAIQAVPEDEDKMAIIEVQELVTGGKVLIKIKDNGEGIPEEMKNKIFTPNFTTKTSGTGLGLAMCKGIVEQSKGQIWFETKAGNGSVFFVELPLGG
jgi:two-component system, NtrC family, nitrogen regulation sensor histidine kinase NtrY